jgi:hypothetical protein
MNIEWNSVTWYSQIVAIVMAVGIFALGFYLGQQYQMKAYENALKAELDQMVYDAKAMREASTTPAE